MAALTPPVRQLSFTDAARNNPRGPFPADRLDAQIQNLIEAIHSTQQALADIRRDDGKLKNRSVGPEQLQGQLVAEIDKEAERRIAKHTQSTITAANLVLQREQNVHLRALDAEAAATTAAGFMSAINAANALVEQNTHKVINATDIVDAHASDSENWANYSQAQATNAKAEQEQAAAWAEYLAGPVVNSNDAPAYISGSPWGRGLYYQPVEGYGGTGGLWSAKWWAIYAAQMVGPWSIYYLGGWSDPPVPGAVNPDTGLKVPSPLPPGSFYYDTDSGTVYFWNGSEWISPYELAAGVTSRFVYHPATSQSVFSGPDMNGLTPSVGQSASDVHLNGIKLVPTLDYTVNPTTSTLTLVVPAAANSYVQWDLLVPSASLAPGAVNAFKVALTPATLDGVNKNFTMQYTNPTTGLKPVNVTTGAQLQVVLDGIVQEPGGDYTATGAALTMTKAPPADGHFWVVWFANATQTP